MRIPALALVVGSTLALACPSSGAAPKPPRDVAAQARAQVQLVMALRGETAPAAAVARRDGAISRDSIPARELGSPRSAPGAQEAPAAVDAPTQADADAQDAPRSKSRLKDKLERKPEARAAEMLDRLDRRPSRHRAAPMPATSRLIKPNAVNADSGAAAQDSAAAKPMSAKPLIAQPKPINATSKRSIRLPSSVAPRPVSSADSQL